MPLPTRALSKDALLWGVSGGFVLAGAVLCTAAGKSAASAVDGVPVSVSATTSNTAGGFAEAPSARPIVFRDRLAALKPLEAALARVFLPPAPPAPLGRAIRMARVVPGRTAEACLAQAVYYEARGEPAEGQAAVAQVVLNRTRSGRHPTGVCGVVFEGAARPGCQFSFACDGRLGRHAPEPGAWRRAQGVAADVLAGRGPADLRTALNYHAESVRPRWAAQLQRTAEIGRHVFYASTRAATRALSGWSFTAPAPPSSGA